MVVSWTGVAVAGTLQVPGSYPTIQEAIDQAQDGDTIHVASGTYRGSVVVNRNVTLEGEPGAVLRGDQAYVVEIEEEVDATVRNLEIDGENARGGIRQLQGSSLTVWDSDVHDVWTAGFGGGIWSRQAARLTVERSTFERGTATLGGLLCFEEGQELIVSASTFRGGISSGDGGSMSARFMPQGTVTIRNSRFEDSTAADDGGGLAMTNAGTAVLTSNLFCGNSAEDGGGGLDFGSTDVSLMGNVFVGNTAMDQGGAIYSNSTFLMIHNNHFVLNHATHEGGAVYAGARFDAVNNLIAYNTAALGSSRAFHDRDLGGITYYMLYFENAPGDSNIADEQVVLADPTLSVWPLQTPCAVEALVPALGSPAIDGGDPAILDVDGTVSDIGAFGGPTPFAFDEDGDGFFAGQDCDDDDPLVHPLVEEICNGRDDNCDGELPAQEQDVDQDGWSSCEGDCVDSDASIAPDQVEVPGDGVDQDCDALELCFVDGDGDGVGGVVAPSATWTCTEPGWSSIGGDCDDEDASIRPGALEQPCNGIDEDCDASTPDCPPRRLRPEPARAMGCGCDAAPRPGWGWSLALGLLVFRRSGAVGARSAGR